jgi:hypothetical protein
MRTLFPALPGLAAAALSFTSCQDADRLPMPATTSLALVRATVDADADTFNLLRARVSNITLPALPNPTRPLFRFTLDLTEQRDARVTKVFVYKTYRRGSNASVYNYGPRVLAREVTTFPTTLTFDSQEALTDLTRFGDSVLIPIKARDDSQQNRVSAGEAIIFTYEYEAEINGQTQRVILTPTSKVAVSSPSPQTVEVISGTQITPPYSVVVTFR